MTMTPDLPLDSIKGKIKTVIERLTPYPIDNPWNALYLEFQKHSFFLNYSSRISLEIEGYVCKLEPCEDEYQSRDEYNTYTELIREDPEGFLEYLLPIFYFEENCFSFQGLKISLLIEPKIERFAYGKEIDAVFFPNKMDALEWFLYEQKNHSYVELADDLHWGLYQGKIVCFDYG